MQNLYKKLKFSKKVLDDQHQQSISILLAGKGEEMETKNMKLVSALNRGGLWFISDNMQKIFVIAEKKLSKEISSQNRHLLLLLLFRAHAFLGTLSIYLCSAFELWYLTIW